MNDPLIVESFQLARKNWETWRNVFEHGHLRDNPLLVDPGRFARFLTEYSVRRTIRAGTHDRLRQVLADETKGFARATRDDSGHSLDEIERTLRVDFGTRDGRCRITSILSKVAAFIRPERFIAWDTYGRLGANVSRGIAKSRAFSSYAEYLSVCDSAWDGSIGNQIRDYIFRLGAAQPVEKELRFQRRVLDVYLMKLGGRRLSGSGRG